MYRCFESVTYSKQDFDKQCDQIEEILDTEINLVILN